MFMASGFSVHQLYERFPGQEVMYGVRVTVPPSLLLSPGRASWVGEVEASVYVLDLGQPQLAFSVLVVSVFQCGISLGPLGASYSFILLSL